VSQLQGDSAPTRLTGTGNIVHLALWSPLLYRTRCGVSFSIEPAWVDGAERVEEPVSCMTCLIRADVFEVPLQSDEPATNPFDERVWLKQVFGPPYNHVTECCHGECPCDWHEPKQS
jgi:hypothetical protein